MLLLDSQIVLWIVTNTPRLGNESGKLVMRTEQVFVSAATVLELTIKSMLGKLKLPEGFIESLPEQGLLPLPISQEDAAGISAFPELNRHDPFDRLLVSQAKVRGLILLTADRLILARGYDFVRDAAS